MDDRVRKQIENIMEKKEWEEFWRQYEEAFDKEDWKVAHDQLKMTLIPKLLENNAEMIEYLKQRDEVINKSKELIEKSDKVIKHYEAIINEYESRGGQK